MKNKFLTIIAITLLFLIIGMITVSAADNEYLGDADGNGKVNAADARIILRHSSNLEKVTDEFAYLADINGDDKINAADARIALRMSASLEDLFKFGEEYHLHDYETVILKNASCTEEGNKQDVCKICNKITKEVVIEKTAHTYVDKIEKEATCSVAGEKHSVCSSCGDVVVSTIEKLAHSYTDATCTKPKMCIHCGDKIGVALGHDYQAATCTQAKRCKICGTREGMPLEHTVVNGKCTSCGQKVKSVEDYTVECITEDFLDNLRNPSSLIVNKVKYIYVNDSKYLYVININYSAMNGFGGYNTDDVYYYVYKNGGHSHYQEYLADYTSKFLWNHSSVKTADVKYIREVLADI